MFTMQASIVQHHIVCPSGTVDETMLIEFYKSKPKVTILTAAATYVNQVLSSHANIHKQPLGYCLLDTSPPSSQYRFMKGYSAPEVIADDYAFLEQLEPYNCDWFATPGIAISMMAQAVTDCAPILDAYKESVFSNDFIEELNTNIQPVVDLFRRLNKKDTTVPPPDMNDITDFLKFSTEDGINLNSIMDDAIQASGALLTMSTQCCPSPLQKSRHFRRKSKQQ